MRKLQTKGATIAGATILELNAPGMSGIEASACMLEIRLALIEYRDRHGPDYWRLFYLAETGRA